MMKTRDVRGWWLGWKEDVMWIAWIRRPRPRLVFDVFEFADFLDFYILWCFWVLRFKMEKKTRKYIQGKCVSNTQEHQTHQQSYKVSTRMYKDQLEGVLNIRKVHEAQMCRWSKILPHSWGDIVTQISSFTSQRYKVLWGLAKSDNIFLPREVSFDSPPDFYTPPEHWSWGYPKGW